jgi:hypothetical protein
MKKVYNFKLRGTGGSSSGIGIGGIGIGNPDGEGIGIDEPDEAGESDDISPEGYMFYNFRLDRILYYLTCSNGDSLGSVNDVDLRAYNV